MIGKDLKEESFPSRKDYLVALAVLYIREHTGFVGMDDDVFFDDAECDGYALADDLEIEFDTEK